MIRYAVIGFLLFAGFGVAFAPAGLLDRILETRTTADLANPRGTLWRGHGELLVDKVSMGMLTWDFQAFPLLRATPTYNWTLHANDRQLNGSAAFSIGSAQAAVEGHLTTALINQWLQFYDITISGAFEIEPTSISIEPVQGKVSALDGQINWNGGLVRYTLSGILRETSLPPLSAFLGMRDDDTPEAVIYATGEPTPLLMVSLQKNGFAKVGLTKLFTKMLNNPWPGNDPEHAVVIEVEEKIF